MKRLAIAGVLALGILACSQQRASAWSKFCFNVGLNLSWETSGFCFSSCCNFYSPPCPYGGAGFSGFGGFDGGYPAYGQDGYAAYPSYAPATPSSTFTAPKPTPASGPAVPGASYAGYQPVNYSYYGQGGYNYGYGGYGPAPYQAPSYWYDR